MKKIVCAVLCILMLWGCAPSNPVETMPKETQQETLGVTVPEETTPAATTNPVTGEPLSLGETGCVRIPYTNNISRAQYVTRASDLPDDPALEKYDDAYFEHHALLVVLETTGSGSVKVGIESVSDGVVTLSHEMPGDVGTADMATWLLWAEVPQGLAETWTIANGALSTGSVTH